VSASTSAGGRRAASTLTGGTLGTVRMAPVRVDTVGPTRSPKPKAPAVRLSRILLTPALLGALVLGAAAPAAAEPLPLRTQVAQQGDPTPAVVLRGAGWGHSVGMSQFGAYGQAREGRSAEQILAHYFPGTALRPWAGGQAVRVNLTAGSIVSTPVVAVGGPLTWYVGTASFVQPAGHTWTAGWEKDRDASELTVTDQAGDEVFRTLGGAEIRLTPVDEVEPTPSPARIRTYNPKGLREYAYGTTTFRAAGSRLTIRQDLPIEGYVRGIDEVPSGWGTATNGGFQALRAQAVAARTFMLRNGSGGATPAFQVYVGYTKELESLGGLWRDAVDSTAGTVVSTTAEGTVSLASSVYSSSHAGRSEAAADSWAYGGTFDYLRSVDDPWSLSAPGNGFRSWSVTTTHNAFRSVVANDLSRITRIRIAGRTEGGTPRVLRVTGPEGTRDYTVTRSGARLSSPCGTSRRTIAGANLLCDLRGTVRNASGAITSTTSGRPPSQQFSNIGFAPFLDDDGDQFEYDIVWAHAAGVAAGVTSTEFAPMRPVTRGQMAAFLYRTFDLPRQTSSAYSDTRGNPHEEAIASVSAAGIAFGYDDGTFRPYDEVSRAQMASFLARALDLSPKEPRFVDVGRNNVHRGSIGALAATGITAGCDTDRFCPHDAVLRRQMAAFLHRTAAYAR
jgi:SpoIID/LytB domain protein